MPYPNHLTPPLPRTLWDPKTCLSRNVHIHLTYEEGRELRRILFMVQEALRGTPENRVRATLCERVEDALLFTLEHRGMPPADEPE